MKTVGQEKIIDGGLIFKLVDTHGLPLDIIVMELRDKELGFNILEFVQAAKKAGWKQERVLWMLKSTGNVGGEEQTNIIISFVYNEQH